jgi:hypothetical protein
VPIVVRDESTTAEEAIAGVPWAELHDAPYGLLFDAALVWCVHHDGIVISGERPAAPSGMSFESAERAYRQSVIREAQRIAQGADVLARAGSAFNRERRAVGASDVGAVARGRP